MKHTVHGKSMYFLQIYRRKPRNHFARPMLQGVLRAIIQPLTQNLTYAGSHLPQNAEQGKIKMARKMIASGRKAACKLDTRRKAI